MQASRSRKISMLQFAITLLIVVFNNVDLFFAYQPYQYPGFHRSPKLPVRPILRPPLFKQRPDRFPYPNRAQPQYNRPQSPNINTPHLRFPMNTSYNPTSSLPYATEKPSTTTTAIINITAITTQSPSSPIPITKLQLQLKEDTVSALLSSMERDGSLKEFGMPSEKMKKILKQIWPTYKKVRNNILEKEKIRSEMQQLKEMYLKKKHQFRNLNRFKQHKTDIL